MNRYGILAGLAGYVFAAMFMGLYIGAKTDLATERERCNSDKIQSTLDSERLVAGARVASLEARVTQLAEVAQSETKAREIAVAARIEAESRPGEVRTIIREVASENACLSTAVPGAVLDGLRGATAD